MNIKQMWNDKNNRKWLYIIATSLLVIIILATLTYLSLPSGEESKRASDAGIEAAEEEAGKLPAHLEEKAMQEAISAAENVANSSIDKAAEITKNANEVAKNLSEKVDAGEAEPSEAAEAFVIAAACREAFKARKKKRKQK
jgi:hypothetical protein